MELLSRELGVPVYKLVRWRTKAEAGLEGALKEREADTADGELAAALRRIGELSMENELARARRWSAPPALWPAGGNGDGRDALSRRRTASCGSAGSGTCRGRASTPRTPAATRPPAAPARRGPKPTISDAGLLAAIRADLARSPWSREGHRKVWARLRVLDGSRVARKRVLRLMRENALLSPHRSQRRAAETHDRSIVTDAPNLMWATDATQGSPPCATARSGSSPSPSTGTPKPSAGT